MGVTVALVLAQALSLGTPTQTGALCCHVDCYELSDDGQRYLDDPRTEVAEAVPPGRVLDVGCSRGAFGVELKRLCSSRVVFGIEPTAAADYAKTRLDGVVRGSFPEDFPIEWGRFDVLCFNDVLEHLVDPWNVLKQSRRFLAPGGAVVASIPNVRYMDVLLDLVLRGEWRYEETGVLDRTHLRFFTRASVARLFIDSGFAVGVLRPIHLLESSRLPSKVIRKLGLAPYFADVLAQRYLVIAYAADDLRPSVDSGEAQAGLTKRLGG